jgi:hypothetical protein
MHHLIVDSPSLAPERLTALLYDRQTLTIGTMQPVDVME